LLGPAVAGNDLLSPISDSFVPFFNDWKNNGTAADQKEAQYFKGFVGV
jgi:hypothetical protein